MSGAATIRETRLLRRGLILFTYSYWPHVKFGPLSSSLCSFPEKVVYNMSTKGTTVTKSCKTLPVSHLSVL